VEITWPDTRQLRHCLGEDIDVRIEVDEDGTVLSVEPVDKKQPKDCMRAAIESARAIVFEPGEVDGVPTRMWTQVRIEFRKKG
jgi:TonB family protein